jgi:PAS domain S-box-containing protein
LLPLRWHLALLILGAVLPVVVFSAWMLGKLLQQERDTWQIRIEEKAAQLTAAVDNELRQTITALEVLGLSRAVAAGDLEVVHTLARRLVAAQPAWENLQLLGPRGEHLLNARVPYGSSLPALNRPDLPARAARERIPVVSDLVSGVVANRFLTVVYVPVILNGAPKYVLAAAIETVNWQEMLASRLGSGLEGVILDRQFAIVASTIRREGDDARTPQPSFLDAMASGEIAGGRRTPLVNGLPGYGAYRKSSFGWSVGAFVPAEAVDAPVRSMLSALATGFVLLIVAGLSLAALLARRVGATITQLVASVRAVSNGGAALPVDSRIAELREAGEALHDTAALLAGRLKELRTSEAKLRAVFRSLAQGLVYYDARGRVEEASDSFQADHGKGIYGLTDSGTEHAAKIIRADGSLLPPEDQPAMVVLRTGKPVHRVELGVVSRDGRVSWKIVDADPVFDDRGELLGAVATFFDTTALKRAEEALRRANEQLRESDRRKDEFLATLAHELRNPLAPIRNATHLLGVQSAGDERFRTARDIIERQVQHMVRLIDDLLDVSRISRGKLELRRQRLALSTVLEQALEQSRPHLAHHEVTLRLPAGAIHVNGDPVRLAQVFSNLLNNAGKFTPKGGCVEVSAERCGPSVTVKVKDTGAGIAPEHLPHLFRMFAQGGSPVDRAQEGLGIGLALVRGLVEMHGGSVEARSEGLGKGSEFVVRLPVCLDPASSRDGSMAATAGTNGSIAGRRVLVVEDNADSAQSLALLLRMAGADATTANGGIAALGEARSAPPDAILLDIGLPDIDGYEVCRGIRAEPWGRTVPMIAMTGWGQEEDRRKSKAAGFDAHLVKPVDPSALMKTLAELLERPAARAP